MRIQDTRGVTGAGAVKGASKKKEAGGFDNLIQSSEEPGQATATSAVSSTAPLGSLDGLLVAQDFNPEAEALARQLTHGHNLLENMRTLQMNLIEGRISATTVQQLIQETRGAQGESNAPQLNAILADIELRAEVELAKLEKAYSNKP